MNVKKWNYKTHSYDDVTLPKHYNCKTFSYNMEDKVNCPHCGKEIEFGDSYTSLEFHTSIGMGYAVCESCYEEEYKRKMNNV